MAQRKTTRRPRRPARGEAEPPVSVVPGPDAPGSAGPGSEAVPGPRRDVDGFIAALPPDQADRARRLRDLVRQIAPAAREGMRWSRPVWEMNGPFCWLSHHPRHLELGLWRGRQIQDPKGLLEGTDRSVAHLRIDDDDAWPEQPILDFLRQALELDRRYGDPTRV